MEKLRQNDLLQHYSITKEINDMHTITRDEAYNQGLKRYFTGIPCKRGHVAERYVSMGGCAACLSRSGNINDQIASPVHTPVRPLLFRDATALEAQAAFRYIELNGWHTAAVKALRDDPAAMERCTAHLTPGQRHRLDQADIARGEALERLLRMSVKSTP